MKPLRAIRLLLMPLLLAATSLADAADFPDTQIPMHQKGTQTLYVEGSIASFGTTEFMVDTGASYLALSQAVVKALLDKGEAEFVRELKGTMADGRTRTIPIYNITRLEIGSRCTIENVEAAVLPGTTRNILGLSALRKTSPFMLDLESSNLLLSNCQVHDA